MRESAEGASDGPPSEGGIEEIGRQRWTIEAARCARSVVQVRHQAEERRAGCLTPKERAAPRASRSMMEEAEGWARPKAEMTKGW